MTRIELLKILVGQARDNGFEFRRWYTTRLGLEWINAETSFAHLDAHRRYYALLFSHDFARSFWKSGEPVTFQVPSQSFKRQMADGTVRVVTRKPFMRRSARNDVWRYHLREMAVAEEPLRYMRKFLPIQEDLAAKASATGGLAASPHTAADAEVPRPIPQTLALARQTHHRRQLKQQERAANSGTEARTKRSPRLPGSR